MMPVYDTDLSIGETPEGRRMLLEGQGFSDSQIKQIESNYCQELAKPTTSNAEQHMKGVIVQRPKMEEAGPDGVHSSYNKYGD